MAIKVNGTTVIDDSRNLVNIVSGAGSSTDYDAVGTYALLYKTAGGITEGSTHAGSGLVPFGFIDPPIGVDDISSVQATRGGTAVSGTWRAMGRVNWASSYAGYYRATLYVRIS